MTKEQEEAIEILNQLKEMYECLLDYREVSDSHYKIFKRRILAINIVLSMLEEKNKVIDLMAEFIEERLDTCPLADYNYNLNCEKECNNNYIKCWKQYFENKAKEYLKER